MKKLIVAGTVAVALGSVSVPAAARTSVDLFVNVGPPAAPVEIVPAPRVGFVWLPGYWDWRHGHHYWVAGRYVRPRPGFVYEPARWVEYGGRWRYTRPEWRAGDRDRDGVPDRRDRHPDNPYRR
ncbi:MAG TPA: YXWGXW repeat-containing protein [Usitatibacter sp.]